MQSLFFQIRSHSQDSGSWCAHISGGPSFSPWRRSLHIALLLCFKHLKGFNLVFSSCSVTTCFWLPFAFYLSLDPQPHRPFPLQTSYYHLLLSPGYLSSVFFLPERFFRTFSRRCLLRVLVSACCRPSRNLLWWLCIGQVLQKTDDALTVG